MLKLFFAVFSTLIIHLFFSQQVHGQTFPSTFDLSTLDGNNGFTIDTLINTQSSVSSIGDINGDGINDFAIGFPFFGTTNLPSSGQTAVIFGETGGFTTPFDLTLLDGSNGFIINGVGDSRAGLSVSGTGDVNGDGIDDLVIGAPFADPGFTETGIVDAGSAFVVFGQQTAFPDRLELSTLNGTDGFAINGTLNSGLFGFSVSGAGDVNSDGVNDIAIRLFSAGPNIPVDGGVVYIVFGKTSIFDPAIKTSMLDGSNGLAVGGENSSFFGHNLSDIGDVNNDGIDDLVFSASLNVPNAPPKGMAFVMLGKSAPFPPVLVLSALDKTNGFAVVDSREDKFITMQVSGAGDVNGDGVDDFIIADRTGAPGGLTDAGLSHVVFGNPGGFPPSFDVATLDGSNGFSIKGVAEGDASGFSLSGAGDVNGDGIDDVFIGAPDTDPGGRDKAGMGYVIFGKKSAFPDVFELSILDGSNGFAVNGVTSSDRSGLNVSGLGDINNDGIDDIIIGGIRQFSSHIIFGKSSTKTLVSSVLPSARSGFVGGPPITVFATVINGGVSTIQNCKVKLSGDVPVTLNFQETDATNAPMGPANQPYSLGVGQARTFVLSFTPKSVSIGENVFPNFVCDGANVAEIPGVNTVFMSIGNAAVPDILSIGATPDGNGIITVPAGSISFMTASATNIGVGDAPGSQDAAMTVSVDDGGASLPLLVQLCETDATAVCITPLGIGAVSTIIGAGPSFFAVFVSDQSGGTGLPLDPARARVFLRFTDANGTVRSVTSAAVTVP